MTTIDYSGTSTPDVTYSYDLHGNRQHMTPQSGASLPTFDYTYDELDRLTQVAVAGTGSYTVTYAYDRDGNRRQITYPGSFNAVNYSFANDGKLASLTDWSSRTTSYTYYEDGSVKDVDLPQ